VNKSSAVKVLIVDVEPLAVQALAGCLQSSGFECIACHSSSEALVQFRADPDIGIVICDQDLPEMNGIELVETLKRTTDRMRAFEAIILTRRAGKQDVIKALRAGVADYFQKPVNLDALLEGVQRQEATLLERQKSFRRLSELNDRLRFLAASIEDLYQDLDRVRQPAQSSGEDAGQAQMDFAALFAPLSPRQQDVARLVAKGQTNYQIGCELGITENTVKLYVSQVLRLTHMNNRTQLALALSPHASAGQNVIAH
jgi:DNA-binding NarL/FixJ family response regulator